MNVISKNRKAFHNFFIEDRIEAGIVLMGGEVKSCCNHNVDLSDGYAELSDKGMVLKNVHIGKYENVGVFDQHE